MSAADATVPFDDDLLATVAAEYDLSPGALRSLAGELQSFVEGAEAVGGVDGLVYEWRRTFPADPVVHRTPAVYGLAVPASVWESFDERLAFSAGERAALRELHRAQLAAWGADAGELAACALARP